MHVECDCGSGAAFAACCEPLLKGIQPAETPEALMRSRYTAYARKDFDYLLATTDSQRRLEFDHHATRAWMNDSKFTKLEVIKTEDGGNKGVVEFNATFEDAAGTPTVHHEVAKFRRQGGTWYFRPR